MMWVAWRQHRWSIITSIVLLGLTALAIVVLHYKVGAAVPGGGECLAGESKCPHELTAGGLFRDQIELLAQVLYLLPLAVGALAGAPLFAREVSQGSHVFSLTQSISRKRWWATKIAVVLVPLAAATLLLGLLSRWLFWPLLDLTIGPLDPGYFETHGFAMVGYMTLAFVTAATVGLFTKNNVVPIVVTICLLGALAFATVTVTRPHYLPSETLTVEGDSPARQANEPSYEDAWPVGQVYSGTDGQERGPGELWSNGEFEAEENTVWYQPADRYWAFQGIETGIYLVLAGGILALSAVGLRTRLP